MSRCATHPRSAVLVGGALLVLGCTHTPEENVAPADAAPAATPAHALADAASGATAEAPDGARTPIESFCDDAYQADLPRLQDKCAPDEFQLSQSMARAASRLCVHDLKVAVERGRAAVDRDAAAACVAMLRGKAQAQTSEADTFFGRAPCDRVLVGAQAAAQPCRFSFECKDGLACIGDTVEADGACARTPKAGEACTPQPFGTVINDSAAALHHAACATGAFCDGSRCQPRAAAGRSCDKTATCATGLVCAQGKCRPPADAGGPCAAASDCKFGLWCDHGDADAGAGKCATKRDAGQACPTIDACKGRCDQPKGKDGHAHLPGTCAAVCGSG